MYPAVNADLMPITNDLALFFWIEFGNHRRYEKGRSDVVLLEETEYAGHPASVPYCPHDIRRIDLAPSRSSFAS